MKISLVKEGAIVKATVDFTSKEWKDAQEKATVKLGKEIEVPGFRKGHAPYDKVKGLVNPQKVLETAVDSLLPVGYKQVMEENPTLEVMIQPEVSVNKFSNEDLSVTYTITTRPEVKLGRYQGIEIKKEPASVTEEEIKAALAEIQENNAVVSAKEDGVIEKGNIVNFDFEGFVDGKPFDGGKAENYDLEIGSMRFIPGFEDAMIGMKRDQEGEVKVTFPEDYIKDLAGKDAIFKVKIHEVSVKTIPEVNDDLALDANIEGVSNLAELKFHLSGKIQERKQQEVDAKANDELVQTIVKEAEVSVPESIVEAELPGEYERYKQEVEAKGIPFDKYLEVTQLTEESLKEKMKEKIAEGYKTMLVLSEIARINDLKVTNEDIDGEIAKMAQQYGMEVEKVKEIMQSRMNELANHIYSEKINNYLLSVNKLA